MVDEYVGGWWHGSGVAMGLKSSKGFVVCLCRHGRPTDIARVYLVTSTLHAFELNRGRRMSRC